ncbi:MAG: hypothetical protein K0S11_1433, partial [Gammaproteobacteria bacterium]|nr:hypothetical protein [Gammaproteobacteria bacterium]
MKKIISFFKGQADINKQHEQTTPTPSELGKSEVDVASRLPTVQLDLTKFKLKQQELVIERPNFEIKPLALPKL